MRAEAAPIRLAKSSAGGEPGVSDEADARLLDFELPSELIAQEPAERRDDSRLLVVRRDDGTMTHARFRDLPQWLAPESIVVANDSRVVPARLVGVKPATGGRVEVLVLDSSARGPVPCMVRAAKPLIAGHKLRFAGDVEATIAGPVGGGRCRLDFDRPVAEVLDRYGRVPLPPYIRREATESDVERYQTVYADVAGSVAAPTAGLHFSAELLARLATGGVEFRTITLHVGPGTFAPVRGPLAEHHMEAERYRVAPAVAAALNAAREHGRRIVAVGTTTVRALESAWDPAAGLRAGEGETALFIRPGFRFRMVDALITNFHLPGTSLLALVAAFTGAERLRAIYAEAISRRYRFYSYGDALLLL